MYPKKTLRDVDIIGPRPITPSDVDAINRIFSDAFTDRYRRDGLVGVRVPRLNPQVWRYALEGAGEGAMLWRDRAGQILAFNVAHRSGTEGWMGPLAVRTDQQGSGVGQIVVNTAISWLRGQKVKTIGLETMPRTVDNIGFYSQLGFLPGHLTITLVADVPPTRVHAPSGFLLSKTTAADRAALIKGCRMRLTHSAPGYDFTRELDLTETLCIGDTLILGADPVRGFALWHAAALVESRPAEELRLLKLFSDSLGTFDELVTGLEVCAANLGLRRVSIRCQSGFNEAYALLMQRGYRVRWTDLRMTLAGYPSADIQTGEVLYSNWEI